jgi:hypothetical protein
MKMKKLIYLVFSIVVFQSCSDTKQINIDLKSQLDSIYHKDQALRELFFTELSDAEKNKIISEFNLDTNYLENKWQIILHQDSLNLQKVESIIAQYGYPGKTLVGDSTHKAAWYVIQHSHTIEKYLPMIEQAGRDGELDFINVAMMNDRFLMGKHEVQIYGTQGCPYIGGYIIWPLKDAENINTLRKEIGFETTIEEYSKLLGFDYRVIELQDAISYMDSMGYY